MINLESEFSQRVNPADANYPFGSIKDNTSPGANDGTPLAAVWGNDFEGFRQATASRSAVTPSGLPDTAQDSQLLDALDKRYLEIDYQTWTFAIGGLLTDCSQAVKHTDGKWYSWSGVFPVGGKVVTAGTDPTVVGSGYVPRTDVVLRNELADDGGAGLIGDIAKPITHFGATLGVDCSAAVMLAMASNKPFFFPAGEWLCSGDVSHTGSIYFYGVGESVIKSDKVWTITDGSGSSVSNVKFMPITTPYTLKRNTATWVNSASDVIQSTEGYQPSALDVDIWSSLSTTIKNQSINESISNGLMFKSTTVFGISDVHINGVSGRCCSIKLEGAVNSSVDSCKDIGSGPRNCIELFNGAIVDGTIQLPRGSGNSVTNCSTRYASQCGIVYWGQDNIKVIGNTSMFNGESGIKCYQRDSIWSSAISSQGDQLIGNTTAFNYYDGIDAQRFYEVPDAGDLCLATIVGNTSLNNRHTGITVNGAGGTASANTVYANGSHGLSVKGNNWTVSGNNARNNAILTDLGFSVFDIILQGDGINSSGNHAENASAPFTYNYVHTGALAADPSTSNPGSDIGNSCSAGPSRMLVSVNLRGSNWKSLSVISGSSYTLSVSDYQLDIYPAATFTLTLPPASDSKGRCISIRNTNTFAINSASSNVGPLAGGAPTSSILSNASGKWCELQSDGSTWKIVKAN